METYIKLEGKAADEYRALLEAERENKEIMAMEMTWAETLEARGLQKGIQKGRQEGRQEGMRQLLLRQLEQRFGPIPLKATERLAAISSTDELTVLAAKVLTAESLEELGLLP